MPQQFQINYPPSNISNSNNSYYSARQPTYTDYPQSSGYSAKPQSPSYSAKPQSPQKYESNQNNTSSNFQRFYGPVSYYHRSC